MNSPSTTGVLSRETSVVPIHSAEQDERWWRHAVIYQVYPRSFRDATGDGVGDLAGITQELHHLADLGVDAVWLSPFYPSPQRDGGYDVSDYCDVDPVLGTLADADELLGRARELGIKVIIDLVPNHCSSEHPLFQAALDAGPGSPEREVFHFLDGSGPDGSRPPNNWQSHFGGSAWTRVTEADGRPGQWYLHLFDSSQPDFNWDNPAVHAEFERILRFWLDRGVAGFRVDVAHALVKAPGLPDWGGRADGSSMPGFPGHEAPMFGQEAVHDIYRRWRSILDSYGDGTPDGDRVLCAEACVQPESRQSSWVRPDEMHQAFNFSFLGAAWDADAVRTVVEASLRAFDAVGAPTTWVLSNHDVVRHATRLGFQGELTRPRGGVGRTDDQPDAELGLVRARAATLLMLGLPGAVYLYQGEELGLPDHTTMADEHRQDPAFHRTGGLVTGRDGCRVPLPWTASEASYGFSPTGRTWLPQPDGWAGLSRQEQASDPDSVLTLYRSALRLRKHLALGSGSLSWWDAVDGEGTVAFLNGDVLVAVNMGGAPVELPAGEVLLASAPGVAADGRLAADEAVWLRLG